MSDEGKWRPRVVGGGDASAGLSGAVLFRTLCITLAELIGSAATAALVGRAVRRAQPRSQELGELSIERVDGEYLYVVPRCFDREEGPPVALQELASELHPLLEEMTGEIALRHLARVPELRSWAAGPLPN